MAVPFASPYAVKQLHLLMRRSLMRVSLFIRIGEKLEFFDVCFTLETLRFHPHIHSV